MMGSRTISTPAGGVAASLPVRGPLHDRLAQANALALQNPSAEDMELDMQFGGSDDDDRAGSGRSGSADFDMEMEVDESGEVITQALGTGSGGVKGRRKGETFDCEYCGKVSGRWNLGCKLDADLLSDLSPSKLFEQAPLGAQPSLERADGSQHEQTSAGADS